MPSPSPEAELCPLCGRLNATTRTHCRHCRYRLPWADALETAPPPRLVADELPAITQTLEKWGALPKGKCACRFCDEPIEVDARQCPHCHKWLTATRPQNIDPWQAGFRDKDVEQVKLLGPRAGCFSIIAVFAAVMWLAHSA